LASLKGRSIADRCVGDNALETDVERIAAVPSELAGPYPSKSTIHFTCSLPRLATSGFMASIATSSVGSAGGLDNLVVQSRRVRCADRVSAPAGPHSGPYGTGGQATRTTRRHPPLRRQWKVFSNRRFLPQSSHGFSRGSCKRSDDRSDTGKQEGDAAPIAILPKESKPKPCGHPSSEQGHPDNPCNQRHGRAFPVRGRSTGPPTSPDRIISRFVLQS